MSIGPTRLSRLTRRSAIARFGAATLVSACSSARVWETPTGPAAVSAQIPSERLQSLDINPARFQNVERLFAAEIDKGRHPGASLAIYRYGEFVGVLNGGVARKNGPEIVTDETLFGLYSCTKTWCAYAAHLLVEQGKLDLNKRIADYWPEFAANGKENVTVAQGIAHRGGFPLVNAPTKNQTPAQLIEATPLSWEPGEANGYHAVNYGFFVEELVRRITGIDLPTFLKSEVFDPLGMKNSYLGLPDDAALESRVAYVYLMEKGTPGEGFNFGFDTENPPVEEWKFAFNRPEVHQMVLPSGGGISSAVDMARFIGMLANGGEFNGMRFLSSGTVEDAIARTNKPKEIDKRLRLPMPWGSGFMLGGNRWTAGFGQKSTDRTFGHYGAGCTTVFGDLDRGLGVAYLTNGNRKFLAHLKRSGAVADAIFDALN